MVGWYDFQNHICSNIFEFCPCDYTRTHERGRALRLTRCVACRNKPPSASELLESNAIGMTIFFSLLRTSVKLNRNHQLEPTGIQRASCWPAPFLQNPANGTGGRSRLLLVLTMVGETPGLYVDSPLTRGSCVFKHNCYIFILKREGWEIKGQLNNHCLEPTSVFSTNALFIYIYQGPVHASLCAHNL